MKFKGLLYWIWPKANLFHVLHSLLQGWYYRCIFIKYNESCAEREETLAGLYLEPLKEKYCFFCRFILRWASDRCCICLAPLYWEPCNLTLQIIRFSQHLEPVTALCSAPPHWSAGLCRGRELPAQAVSSSLRGWAGCRSMHVGGSQPQCRDLTRA